MLILSFCAFLYSLSKLLWGLFSPHPRSGRHYRSGCLTGPGEAGRGRRNEWGGLKVGWEAAALTAATGKSEPFVPENLVVTSTREGILAPVFGPPWEAETGLEPLQTLKVVHEEGSVRFAFTHTLQSRLVLLFVLKLFLLLPSDVLYHSPLKLQLIGCKQKWTQLDHFYTR